MDIHIYRRNLDKVISAFGPATFETVSGICPHLSEAAVLDLLARASRSTDLVEFAVPSVLIANSYHVCGIAPPLKCSGFLGYHRHKRMPSSFADGKVRFTFHESRPTLFVDEALAYARDNWGEHLQTDTWQSVVKFKLYRPQHNEATTTPPEALAQVAVSLSQSLADLQAAEPQLSEVLDESVIRISTHLCEEREMAGGRQVSELNNCACCGAALDLATCKTCGIEWCFRPETPLPVPARVMKFLQKEGLIMNLAPMSN